MASVGESSGRANIRIEIKNDFSEDMEVDYSFILNPLSDGEVEDGEISDDKRNTAQENQTRKIFTNRNVVSNRMENKWQNTDGGFTTGVDIFAKDEQEKLQTRAHRFGLDPLERTSMTDQQLQELHESLGIMEDEEINTRFEAIHMHGTQEMSTQEVFTYFGKYGPSSIEWINDESCNVVWLDRISAARAFHGLSRPVEGMPVTGKCDPFQKENENDSKGRSILLIAKTNEIVSLDNKEKIHVSDINIPVPPGYWRLGMSHPKAKCILLRFAKRSDRKPLRAERFSEYYKKYGNPNYGGIKGLISESKKKKLKGLPSNPTDEKVESGNPWGNLAKNWNNDVFEKLPESRVPYLTKVSKSIQNRLGNTNKRVLEEEEEVQVVQQKKSKVPRMRMYADEEEKRIEKVKQLKKIKEMEKIEEQMVQPVPDLRNRIGRHTAPVPVKIPLKIDNIPRQAVTTEHHQNHLDKQQNISSESEEEQVNVKQRSKVTVIVKKPSVSKPTVASTIWSRLDLEKRKQTRLKIKSERNKTNSESDSESSKSTSSESESDSDNSIRNKLSTAVNNRPGFNRDLKSRLGLNSDHHPLRIEINNDHYKKS